MKKLLCLAALVAVPLTLTAQSPLVRFDGGIGVDPVSGILGTAPVLNVVRGVNPGGVPWVIRRLRADVQIDGSISVEGRGLLLAGGNGIGTTGGLSVLATLFCGAPATATAHSSNAAGVALDPHGDFRIDDVLSPLPPVPCTNPVLLIVNATAPRWFAAGIPK